MGFHRKQRDHQKVNNLVAKHDHNKGGFHDMKSHKQSRRNNKVDLNKIDLDEIYEEGYEDEPSV